MAVIVPYWPYTFAGNCDCDLRTSTALGVVTTHTNQQLQLLKPYMGTVREDLVQSINSTPTMQLGGSMSLKFRGLLKTEHIVTNRFHFLKNGIAQATRLLLANGFYYYVADSFLYLDHDDDSPLYYVYFALNTISQP